MSGNLAADENIPTAAFMNIPLKMHLNAGVAWRNSADVLTVSLFLVGQDGDCHDGEVSCRLHDKLTTPTSLTRNEASGRWATADDITAWFLFIVWQDRRLVCA